MTIAATTTSTWSSDSASEEPCTSNTPTCAISGRAGRACQVPGPKVAALLKESRTYEAFTRGSGPAPVILEHGKGATVKTIGDVRGRGLMMGVEVVYDHKTKAPLAPERVGEITMSLLNRGIIVTPCGRYGNVFRFMLPLTIPRDYTLKATETMIDVLR